jgi:hypothetical protein
MSSYTLESTKKTHKSIQNKMPSYLWQQFTDPSPLFFGEDEQTRVNKWNRVMIDHGEGVTLMINYLVTKCLGDEGQGEFQLFKRRFKTSNYGCSHITKGNGTDVTRRAYVQGTIAFLSDQVPATVFYDILIDKPKITVSDVNEAYEQFHAGDSVEQLTKLFAKKRLANGVRKYSVLREFLIVLMMVEEGGCFQPDVITTPKILKLMDDFKIMLGDHDDAWHVNFERTEFVNTDKYNTYLKDITATLYRSFPQLEIVSSKSIVKRTRRARSSVLPVSASSPIAVSTPADEILNRIAYIKEAQCKIDELMSEVEVKQKAIMFNHQKIVELNQLAAGVDKDEPPTKILKVISDHEEEEEDEDEEDEEPKGQSDELASLPSLF